MKNSSFVWMTAMSLVIGAAASCSGQQQVEGNSLLPGGPTADAGTADGLAADADRSADGDGQTCSTSFPVSIPAENAQLTGVDVANEVIGFRDSGYIANFSDVGDQVTFEICVPRAGYYTLEFRYAKGTENVATRTILVDGQEFAAHPRFLPAWDWSTWADGGRRSIHLTEGTHRIALAYTSADTGEVRLDTMTLSAGPSPSEVSVRSLFMNNWEDLVVGWHAANLHPADDSGFGPHMTALHSRIDWPTNQLDQAQAYLRDNTGGVSYDDPNRFDSRAYFTATDESGYGALHGEYGPYGGQALPMHVSRRQVVPPGEDVILVTYEIENATEGPREIALLEWADLHNKTSGPSEDPADTGEESDPSGTLKAEWQEESNAWIVDMTETNGTVMVVGAFEPITYHVAGEPVSGGPDRNATIVQRFWNDPSSLSNASTFESADLAVGLSTTLSLEPRGRQQVSFFYAVTETVDEARALARATYAERSPTAIAQRASQRWKEWLKTGKAWALATPVAAWSEAFQVAMLTIRQAQQPEFGSFVAATNPAYFYSVWPRDAAVTAMGLDAAGYLDAAEKYWKWMAQAQADGSNPDFPQGTWWTNYGYWSPSRGIPFVQPEWDSLGLFLTGVYHHHRALQAANPERASAFLSDVWPAVRNAANFIEQGANDPENNGFGPEDYSIWEEDIAYHTFTQTTYVAGLRSAELLAQARGEDRDGWGAAADSIRRTIFRPVSASPCPGLWDDENVYFIRSVKPDCTPDRRVDGATDLLWVLGVLRPDNPRAGQHREAILANLTPGDWGHGISRYEGDTFYHSAEFSPGGRYEALEPMPTWPQMAMYMTMLEHWLGMTDMSSNRLSWYVATAPRGYVPHGEAVDWSTQRPLISTAAEPVTGAWFTLGLLNQLGQFDPRVPQRESWGTASERP